MSLYTRLMGIDPPKIPVHQFFAAMQEFALGNMTAQQATAAFGLSGGEATEANTLLNVILAESGANGAAQRRLKAVEFERVLMLAEQAIAPFHEEAAVKARLGV